MPARARRPRRSASASTLVSASYDRASEQLVAFGADPVGNVVAAHVTLDAIEPVFTLSGGHAGHIRAVHWNSTTPPVWVHDHSEPL